MAKRNFAARAAAQKERDVQAARELPESFFSSSDGQPALLEPEQIQPRSSSTRQLNSAHVEALMESIGALGLIEPIVVDQTHRLLAGGHRLAALRRLREEEPAKYQEWFGEGAPVRIMEFDAELDAARALEVEIAENEHRRDYSRAEVKELAKRLKAAGYTDTVGRPKKGAKALGPALGVIVRKSANTIRKLLADEPQETKAPAHPLAPLHRSLKKHAHVVPEHIRGLYEQLLEAVGKEIDPG